MSYRARGSGRKEQLDELPLPIVYRLNSFPIFFKLPIVFIKIHQLN